MRQLLLILTALLACAATLHGEEPEERRKIVFTPQWTSQCQFAGYYVAQEKGYYADAGLEVEIRQPSTSKPAIEYLKSGESQIITMQLAQALYEMGRGAPLVNILQTSQQSSLLLVSRRPVKDIHDLRGKRIGCWKTNFAVTARAADRILSLQIEWIPFIQNINLFISGAIDGTLATSYNEYYQLLFSGVELSEDKLVRFSRIGYDIPEDGVYVTREFYRKHRDLATKFAEASRKGWEWAAAHPEEALDIAVRYIRMQETGTNIVLQKYLLEETLRLLHDPTDGRMTFRLKPESVAQANRVLQEGDILEKPVSYQLLTEGHE